MRVLLVEDDPNTAKSIEMMLTHAESLDAIAEVGANNHDTSNGVWLVHPTNAATLGA